MQLIKRNVPVQPIVYAANSPAHRELPFTVYRGLELLVKITHTNAANPAPTLFGILYGLISRMQVTLAGVDQLVNIPAWCLWYMNRAEFAKEGYNSIFTTASIQGTSYISLYLPFSLLRAVMPLDTLLDARKLSSMRLEVNWSGTPAGIASIDAAEIQILTCEYAVGEDFKVSPGRHELAYLTKPLEKTGTVQIRLDTGAGNEYRRLWIFLMAQPAAVLSDLEIDRIKLKTRSFVYVDASIQEFKADNTRRFGIDAAPGLYVWDFPTDGRMSERCDATNISDLTLEVNALNTTGIIHCVAEKVVL